MSKCVPGMPCYGADVIVYTTYPRGCATTEPSPYTLPLSSDDVYYAGPNLPNTGIQTEDTITDALQKIDQQIEDASVEVTAATIIAALSAGTEEQKLELATILAPYILLV